MSQNRQGSSNQPPHHPSYSLRNTLKRQEEAKSKSEPPKRSSPFSVTSAYNSVMEGVVGTFSQRRSSPTVSDTRASSLGRPTENSTPASSFPRELILSPSRLKAPTQIQQSPEFPNAIRKPSVRGSTSSVAEDQPTVIERAETDMYIDETGVYGPADLLSGNQAHVAPTINFSTESEQVLRSEE